MWLYYVQIWKELKWPGIGVGSLLINYYIYAL